MQPVRRFLLALAATIAVVPSAQAQEPAALYAQASPGKPLDVNATMTRIAFGSCNRQDKQQGAWSAISATRPDLFIAMGDNVYGDIGWTGDPALQSFRDAYAMQAAHPQFAAFRKAVPMLATWDDHDFGPNDGGGGFAYKALSEDLFEAFWRSGEDVTARPGVYSSVMTGTEGRRVQLILLDTRFFRTPLKGPKGNYVPDDDPGQQMLGEAQWDWLKAELAKPAELRLVVSSIQIISEAHRWEKWANLPLERARLFETLAARDGGEVVLLTGDRHSGGIYSAEPEAMGEEIFEITASSLNSSSGDGDASAREPDPARRSLLYAGENFGLFDIDWAARKATLRLVSTEGHQVAAKKIGF